MNNNVTSCYIIIRYYNSTTKSFKNKNHINDDFLTKIIDIKIK